MKFLMMLMIFLSVSVGARANDGAFDLQEQYRKSLEILEEIEGEESSGDWAFTRFRVRLRSKMALEVPYLSKLEVKPFIEFHYSE